MYRREEQFAPLSRMVRLGKIHTQILKRLKKAVKPGITTLHLEHLFIELARKFKVSSACQGKVVSDGRRQSVPYPTNICVAINDEAIHVYPQDGRYINPGDLVTVDTVITDGIVFTDAAFSMVVDGDDKKVEERRRLVSAAYEALRAGIAQIRAGVSVGAIGHAIEQVIRYKYKYDILEDYGGHSIGWDMWEGVFVPNYGVPEQGPRLISGMYLAIEPLIATKSARITNIDDWITKTIDGSDFVQVEATVLVTDDGYKMITEIV